MEVNPQIFREYDIRGVVGEGNLTPELAWAIGKAFTQWLRSQATSTTPLPLSIVVGRDNRFSSDELSAKLVAGLLSQSQIQVTDVGLSLSPLINFATAVEDYDAGVMITASHNPKRYNGFRFMLRGGDTVYGERIQELRNLVEEVDIGSDPPPPPVGGWQIGLDPASVTYRDDLFDNYLAELLSRIDIPHPLKIVIDCANATPSKFAPLMFERLGCRVTPLFCNLDGDYPYHEPDPEERLNLAQLRLEVVKQKADLGLAFDPDGDRLGVVDEKGTPYESDKVLILFARDLLSRHPGSKVLFDIKSSYVLPQEIEKAGGEAVMIRTGHPYYREKMMADSEILLGGELSGHLFFAENWYGFDDAFYAAAKLAEIIASSGRPLSTHFADVPKTVHSEEIKAPCPDDRKEEIVTELKQFFKKEHDTIEIDGVRVVFSPTSWALVRASHTEPALSIRWEAEDKEGYNRVLGVLKEVLGKYPEVDLAGMV